MRQQVGPRTVHAIRWSSDAPAADAKKDAEAPDAKTENDEATQLRQQVEKKDKEIIDLKVNSIGACRSIPDVDELY